MCGKRAGNELFGRGLIGGWNRKASCGGYDLGIGP